MARSSSSQIFKLRQYLSLFHNYTDTRLWNIVPVRYLRGSRFSKQNREEEIKFQKLLKTLKYGSKPPESSATEAMSSDLQKSESTIENDSEKESCRITPEDIIRKFQDKMIPLKDIPYKKQLDRKLNHSRTVLKVLGKKLQFLNVPIAMGNDKLPCPVDLVTPSPMVEAYRNRDDFSIGLGLDGNDKSVGFFIDPPAEFSTPFCVSPTELPVLKENHKRFAEDFQNYIRLSPLPASQHYADKGYWKNLIVRSNTAGDIMGIVVMHPQELSQDELVAEKEKLKDYFSCVPESRYNLHSLFFQTCTRSRCTHEQSPFELIMGEPFIVEEVNNMMLHISPDSFFHHNTKAAEAMLKALLKICRIKKSTTVLDICCGVGPVSMLFSPKVKKCIGVDDSIQAIIDAKLNAMENRLQNTEFICGQPEITVKDILHNGFHEDLLVILNSSRYPISKPLILMLREFKNVDKIVYMSNKPHTAVDHYIQLCRPCGPIKTLGKAFLPILALPYDISPHTEQFGLIVMFQRLQL